MPIMRKVLIRVRDGAEIPFDANLAERTAEFETSEVDVQDRIARRNRRVAYEAREKIAAEETRVKHKLQAVRRLLADSTVTPEELAQANGTAVGDPDTAPPAPELNDVAGALYPYSVGWRVDKLRNFAKKEYGISLSIALTRAEVLQRMAAAAEARAREAKTAEPEPVTAT